MKKQERLKQIEAYIEHKKRTGAWTDEKPKRETKEERAERLKQNLEKSKARKAKREEELKRWILTGK